jgi:zinc D-Ala-D-Ala carboxypeptidase
MGDLTANFSLDEFLVSETAARHRINNTPTPPALQRIKDVTAPGMQIVRDVVGRAIVMTNAYRNPQVNKIVGGVPTSAHPKGYATDSRAAGLSAFSYACIVRDAMKPGGRLHGKVDQLILESGRSIVHISFDPKARGQVLTQKGGPGTPCAQGLIA